MRQILSTILIIFLTLQQCVPVYARTSADTGSVLLPAPGVMVQRSAQYDPVMVKGIRIHPENPLQFDFIVDTGSGSLSDEQLKPRAATLIKYFLTALTVPDDELWVNLSPYEQDRIIPANFGVTEMGRDLLSQDYLLKQLTASLMYPEEGVGQIFWDRVYQKSQQLFGTTDIPVETFNKVWVVPEKAKIYLSGDAAFIVESRLKVMMEADYLALDNNALKHQPGERAAVHERSGRMQQVSAQMIKDVLIPVIEEEVNTGEHFAPLRQIYHSLILATWYKQNLRESYLARVYVGENKINGIDIEEKTAKERIYQQYLAAFKKGVYNYVREEFDQELQETIPRKYFSGGMRFGAKIFDGVLSVEEANPDEALIAVQQRTSGELRTLPTNITPVTPVDVQPRKDAAILSQETAIDLGDFITHRKLFLTDRSAGPDARLAISDPQAFQSIVNEGREKREPAKIDFLITRQAPIQQSVLELVSNAADAITGRSSSIGRFGVGALQMLAFVLDENNPILESGAHISVNTKTAQGPARHIQFFKGQDGRIKFNVLAGKRKTPGTDVRINFPEQLNADTKELIQDFIIDRLNLFTKMRVQLNGQLINPLDDHIFLNGDKVRYDVPDAQVDINISNDAITVEDSGTGMSDEVILDRYLIPRRGENQDVDRTQTVEDITREVHVFYKGPQRDDQKSTSRIVFQVGGINIQSVDVEGYGLPRELIVQLPSSTKLTVSRDKIEIDETTHTAIRAMADKIVNGQPIHQTALINGFISAVKLLDEANTRVEALQPLVDTAKEIFVPFVLKKSDLILPNNELFRQMQTPPGTMFLDSDITYRVSPDQIPGAQDLQKSFRAGRFSKAYTVPFKPGSDVVFLEAGPYLLINQAVYDRYKDQPMLLNFRLNYYRGYGRRAPPRGWIVIADSEGENVTGTNVLPIIEEFETIGEVLDSQQVDWLRRYFEMRDLPTVKEIQESLLRGERPQMDHVDEKVLLDALRAIDPKSIRREDWSEKPDTSKKMGHLGMQMRARKKRGRYVAVNKDVDASEERVKQLFSRLDAFAAAIPEYMRDRVEWDWILPLSSQSGEHFEELLEKQEYIISPNTEFLDVNAAYFMNQEHPERLQRYISSLRSAGQIMDGRMNGTMHRVVAHLDPSGLLSVDTEVLDMVSRVFANRNMESMEDAFEAINDALPHVEGDGVKRLIMRWLRIYDQDPRAAANFAKRLGKMYLSEQVAETDTYDYENKHQWDLVGPTALTPDGKRMLHLDNGDLIVSDTRTGEEVARYYGRLIGDMKVTSNLAASPDGLYAYVGDNQGNITRWDLESGAARLSPSDDGLGVKVIKSSTDSKLLAVLLDNGKVHIVNPESEAKVKTLQGDFSFATDVTFSPDSQAVVVSGEGAVMAYKTASGRPLLAAAPVVVQNDQLVKERLEDVLGGSKTNVFVTPDSRHVVVVNRNVVIYDLEADGEVVNFREGWPSSFKASALTPDGNRVVLAMTPSGEGQFFDIGVLDLDTLKLSQIIRGHEAAITNITVAPNGRDVISHGSDGKIMISEIKPSVPALTDTNFLSFPRRIIEGDPWSATAMVFSNDGKIFLSRNENSVRVGAAVPTIIPLLDVDESQGIPQRLLGNAVEERFATVGTKDNIIRVYDSETREVISEITDSPFTADQNDLSTHIIDDVLVVASRTTLAAWDIDTAQMRYDVVEDIIQLGPNGRYYVGSGVNPVLRDTKTDRIVQNAKDGQSYKLAQNVSGETLLFVTDRRTGDTSIYNWSKRRPSYVIPSLIGINENVLLSSNNQYMLVPSQMNNTRWDLWDLASSELIISMDDVRRARMLPGLNLAVIERTDAPYMQIIDLEEGKVGQNLPLKQPWHIEGASIATWRVTDDGQYLVVRTEEGTAQIYDLLENRLIGESEEGFITSAFSHDQRYLIDWGLDFKTLSVIDLATGDVVKQWQPHEERIGMVVVGDSGELLITADENQRAKVWRWDQIVDPLIERTGFAALNPQDDLKGLPSMLKTIIRFLRDEDVTLLEQEETVPRAESWQVVDRLSEPVSLAMMNILYEKFSREIQRNPDITFTEFLDMLAQVRDSKLADYINMIRSAIEGQDKTQRAWVREIAIQNARDATRRAREEKTLYPGQGDIEIRNFMEGDDWVFQVREQGTGMNLFDLIRYFFPLDQSSKDYLNDTGNLGQGNYTLFADFDRVLLRTSTGDGSIHELEIINDPAMGPVIASWEVLNGKFKGTEVRRIKNNTKMDPQLESLFIQEALQRFAGAITSPQQRFQRGEQAEIRDVRILYNGETFAEEVTVTAVTSLGPELGDIAVARSDDKFNQRVIQDGIYIKEPDYKELGLVPKWLLAAYERRGGLHVALPRRIQLNIPRTGYAQEHKFLGRLQVGVLHGMMKTVLSDYVDHGLKIPGTPADYFDDYRASEQQEAIRLVGLLHAGKYDEISIEEVMQFVNTPTGLFAVMAYLPFESNAYDGEMTLHEIRERFMVQSQIRPRSTGAVEIAADTKLNNDFTPVGEFADDIEESVGNLVEAVNGQVNGRLKRLVVGQRSKKRDPQEVWDRLPQDTEVLVGYLVRRFIQPIVGEGMPMIDFYNRFDSARANAGEAGMYWNLAYLESTFAYISELSSNPELLAEELRTGDEDSLLWKFLQTLMHETQHLPQYEEPGDHSHHDETEIDGLDAKDDNRFGVRMGRGIDAFLTGMESGVAAEFTRPKEEMQKFIRSTTPSTLSQLKRLISGKNSDSAVLVESDSEEVGGIDLNPQRIDLQVDGTPSSLNINAGPAVVDMAPVEGFYPVIINVLPTNLPLLLGAGTDSEEEPNPQLISALREEDGIF